MAAQQAIKANAEVEIGYMPNQLVAEMPEAYKPVYAAIRAGARAGEIATVAQAALAEFGKIDRASLPYIAHSCYLLSQSGMYGDWKDRAANLLGRSPSTVGDYVQVWSCEIARPILTSHGITAAKRVADIAKRETSDGNDRVALGTAEAVADLLTASQDTQSALKVVATMAEKAKRQPRPDANVQVTGANVIAYDLDGDGSYAYEHARTVLDDVRRQVNHDIARLGVFATNASNTISHAETWLEHGIVPDTEHVNAWVLWFTATVEFLQPILAAIRAMFDALPRDYVLAVQKPVDEQWEGES